MTSTAPPPTGHLQGLLLKGRYRLGGLLARGATAVVYQADDLHAGSSVAVKVLLASQPQHRLRMQREIEAVARLDHPCITRLHDAGELDDRTPYLVMDHLRGETLGEYLRREGTMKPALALPLLVRAAQALHVAHEAGIVHRDVKPDNLFLLGRVGAPEDVRVVDFGLSKAASRLTESGVSVGTAEYMAPEQVLTDPVDGRTDVYALGVVIYRMFSGKLPFDGRDKMAVMAHHLLTPAPPFRTRSAHLTPLLPRLAHLLERALCKRPEHRFASMALLAAELQDLPRPLAAPLPPGRSCPDVYLPRSDFGRTVIGSFYQLLDLPPPPSSRTEPGEE